MLGSHELQQIIKGQQRYLHEDLGIQRKIQLKPLRKFALLVSGIRRCGKSTLLKQHLMGKSPIYYLHFEDIQLASFETKDFARLSAIFEEELGIDGIYFFDEIQNIPGWEMYIRTLVDTGAQVYITGSNATLMSKELGTRLTGRNIRQEIFPFSFQEIAHMHKEAPSLNMFQEYLTHGGMPEYVLQKDPRILEALVHDILYRDLIARKKFTDEYLLKNIITYLLSNTGKELSFTKIRQMFDVGSTNTISSIMHALEDAYLFFTINSFSFSLKKQHRNQRKVYCIDNGFINHLAFKVSEDKGRLLENLVFLQLRREGRYIFFHKDKHECDFLTFEKNHVTQAIQVCYEVSQENKEREYAGLLEALHTYKLKEGMILTFNQEDKLEIEGKTILLLPVWKWILS